jgi:hypothetical protein
MRCIDYLSARLDGTVVLNISHSESAGTASLCPLARTVKDRKPECLEERPSKALFPSRSPRLDTFSINLIVA